MAMACPAPLLFKVKTAGAAVVTLTGNRRGDLALILHDDLHLVPLMPKGTMTPTWVEEV